MDRFWISPADWKIPFSLTGDEAHHCRRVLRKREGEIIGIFDGAGRSATAEITSLSGSEVLLNVSQELHQEKGLQVELAVGIPKGKTFDLIVQKAVELGVTRIQPLITDQGMVKFEGKEVKKKTEKWNRLALEASKQCGQNWLPEVLPPRHFSKWFPTRDFVPHEMVAALTDSSQPLRRALAELEIEGPLRILIGPEGDFSEEEYDRMALEKVQAVSLGKFTLRVETAAFFLISNVFCQLE